MYLATSALQIHWGELSKEKLDCAESERRRGCCLEYHCPTQKSSCAQISLHTSSMQCATQEFRYAMHCTFVLHVCNAGQFLDKNSTVWQCIHGNVQGCGFVPAGRKIRSLKAENESNGSTGRGTFLRPDQTDFSQTQFQWSLKA